MTQEEPSKLDDKDIWRFDSVQSRYEMYCKQYSIEYRELHVHSLALKRAWTAGIMRALIARMKLGDLAAAEIGIEMMEEDRGLTFGSSTKSKLPRALAKCELRRSQKERIRRRVVSMLLKPFLPKEFRQYAWLARRIGLARWDRELEEADLSDPWVDWYVHYLTTENPPRPPRG